MNSDEPVAWLTRDAVDGYWYATNTKKSGSDDIPLYASPPQRQPLTHEQRLDLLIEFGKHTEREWNAHAILIDMVEAKHGIGYKK